MRVLIILMILFSSSNLLAFEDKSFRVSEEIFNNSHLEFTAHTNDGPFGSYLSMDIQYAPVKKLWKELEDRSGLKLKNRGEAHITIVTPVEYYRVLKEKIDIREINEIAKKAKMQSMDFQIECLGKFEKVLDKKNEGTYFIVINSKEILSLRKNIEKIYLSRGGDPKKFQASNFYGHITVGFTKRDLHESDGAFKDKRSCFASITH
ncbi:putative exported protein [Halobacteriovorax marinus SJ]|uniref:Exported protein n=1 Tax=Halobacteriovorax marinus (strain ATCC BAA-682 / DSM 15412 / SJ) TaxID=862908 RepID=E1X4K3_HALMS|nr:hypothetical protein [Halobacteriovorax marinus]CBW25433.1 putative exported protein [Halobacteriovorax marinus SJ]